MNFMELAKKRCSVRAYEDKPVAPEHLQAVLEAGRLAPTGKNHQPQRLLVVQSPEGLEKMAKAMHNTNAYTAKASHHGLFRYIGLLGSQLRPGTHS